MGKAYDLPFLVCPYMEGGSALRAQTHKKTLCHNKRTRKKMSNADRDGFIECVMDLETNELSDYLNVHQITWKLAPHLSSYTVEELTSSHWNKKTKQWFADEKTGEEICGNLDLTMFLDVSDAAFDAFMDALNARKKDSVNWALTEYNERLPEKKQERLECFLRAYFEHHISTEAFFIASTYITVSLAQILRDAHERGQMHPQSSAVKNVEYAPDAREIMPEAMMV